MIPAMNCPAGISLALIRHGETEWNRHHKLQGSADIALSDVGWAQARALRSAVAAFAPEYVAVSSLSRARDTAAALGLEPTVLSDGLIESNLGQWEGQLAADLIAAHGSDYAAWRAGSFTPPGGEDLSAFAQRVLTATEQIVEHAAAHNLSRVAIISHGGVIRMLLRHLVGISPQQLIAPLPASMSIIHGEATEGGIHYRLGLYNYCPAGG